MGVDMNPMQSEVLQRGALNFCRKDSHDVVWRLHVLLVCDSSAEYPPKLIDFVMCVRFPEEA
jgi:hypothetical protein